MHVIQCCLSAGQEQHGVEEGPNSLLPLFVNKETFNSQGGKCRLNTVENAFSESLSQSQNNAVSQGDVKTENRALPKALENQNPPFNHFSAVNCLSTLSQDIPNSLKCSRQVSEFCERLQQQIKSISPHEFILCLGGDHSLAIGSILGALARNSSNSLGVLWVDAHADLNSPLSSITGRMHGCPVGLLLNVDKCRGIHSEWQWMQKQPVLLPSNLTYIGLRDVDEAEKKFIQRLGIKAFWMSHVNEMGIDAVLNAALEHLKSCETIHLSFDVDAVDPARISSTGTPVPGGLSVEQAKAVVQGVVHRAKVCSADIVEFNPRLGNVENSIEAVREIFNGIDWECCMKKAD
jgi:arginase